MRIVERHYGSTDPVYFELWETDGTDFETTPPTFAAGDTQISKDGAAFANATNDPVHEGGGVYSWTPSGTELEAKAILLRIVDSATKVWLDALIVIETKGHPSAMHPHQGIPLPDAGLITGTPTSTTAALGGNLAATDDLANGAGIYFSAGTGAKQAARQIVDYDQATDTVTVDPAWAITPDTTTVYHLIPMAPAPAATANLPEVSVAAILTAALADLFAEDSGTTYASAVAGSVVKEIADNAGGSALTEAGIADAVWDEAQSGHTTAGTFGELATEIAQIITDIAALNDPTAAAIAAAILAEVVEGSFTVQQSLALQNSAAAGKVSGAATTSMALRDLADTLDRMSPTVDADGNRSAITYDFTDL